jgi:hypothetical protein
MDSAVRALAHGLAHGLATCATVVTFERQRATNLQVFPADLFLDAVFPSLCGYEILATHLQSCMWKLQYNLSAYLPAFNQEDRASKPHIGTTRNNAYGCVNMTLTSQVVAL